MFRSRSWFGGGWGRPKNPHSLEHLKYLYNVLARNQTVSEHNRGLLVESLRCIAEILIWGDQNDSSVFDFFLEKNMLSFFLRIMRQRSGGSSYVCVQLLQTLNILFENIRNETSLYYLLSNNHVNSIIEHKFDFSDEEVMAYYISFLKTLSLKLNGHTIHFFYNEHTNDFPLYTEAIKFFNHPESMVRIAVRTLTLNVYRVEDVNMLAFIRDRTAAPYFSNIVWFIGKHVLELDACVRNDADHQSQSRLADLVAEHLDHLHYINDILCLNIIDLNRVLSEHLLHKLLIPLYITSLIGPPNGVNTGCSCGLGGASTSHEQLRTNETTNGRVSSVVALFLLSQVFLIITHAPLVRTLAWIILKADRTIFEHDCKRLLDVCDLFATNSTTVQQRPDENSKEEVPNSVEQQQQQNATDEEKLLVTNTTETTNNCASPFFDAVLKPLDCTENDYAALFALSLLYALGNNKGVPIELLNRILRPECDSNGDVKYNVSLMDKVLLIINVSCQPASRIRLVTFELSLKLLVQLVLPDEGSQATSVGTLTDCHRSAFETARVQSAALLRNFYKSEDIFLDMFEHEYCAMTKGPLNVEWLCMDAAILLPPTGTPMTGIDFTKRLPCGEVERARRAIRVYFLIRDTYQTLASIAETQLPLANTHACVQLDTVLDLNNSDLISCVVVWKDGQKIRRFLVIDVFQLILVEPDTKRLGWGVVKLVGFLQDVEVVGDKDDSRCLHITIHQPLSGTVTNRVPLLSAKFIFDDHIRCMAANQRLTKGRMRARQKKMQYIARLLEIPGQTGPPSPAASVVGSGLVGSMYTTVGRCRSIGVRESRSVFSGGGSSRGPGFATPTADYMPSTSPSKTRHIKSASRDGSSSRTRASRSGDSSPRMPRPRSEEIPLELIKNGAVTAAVVDVSTACRVGIAPRLHYDVCVKDQSVNEETVTEPTGAESIATTTPVSKSEETSFIATQHEKNIAGRKKGAIETI